MSSSTKKSAINLSRVEPPKFDPQTVLMNRALSDKLDQMFDDFERPARMFFQRHGLNAEHETECLVAWIERRLMFIRGDNEPTALHHQAFA
jgi:hypothetical protein